MAIRSSAASGRPASSPAGPSRRRSDGRSRWPMLRQVTPNRVRSSRSRSAPCGSPPRSFRFRSTAVPADPPDRAGSRAPPLDRGGSRSMVPQDLRYTKDHEWVRLAGDVATVGVTKFAADQLGDIVFVELPAVGVSVAAFATFGVVESVK